MEIWKDVREYEGFYQVSNFGRVKRIVGFDCKKERILKPNKSDGKHYQVTLNKNHRYKCYFVHRLVFEAFYRKLQPNEICHHLDGCPDNNVCTNLVAIDGREHSRMHNIGNKHCLGRIVSQQTKQRISNSKMGHKLNCNKDPLTGRFVKGINIKK